MEAGVKDQLIALIAEELASWQPGHPLDPATVSGAVVDKQQLDTILSYIKAGQDEGASLVHGGQQVLAETGGVYVQPTVFSNVKNQMKIASEKSLALYYLSLNSMVWRRRLRSLTIPSTA